MTTILEVELVAKEAGRRFLHECARMNEQPVAVVVDQAPACLAEGCRHARTLITELSIRIATATSYDVDVPSETLIRWCHEVEDEFRVLPRPADQPRPRATGSCDARDRTCDTPW